jgi:hypothetical protein
MSVLWRIAESSKTFRYFRDVQKNNGRFLATADRSGV